MQKYVLSEGAQKSVAKAVQLLEEKGIVLDENRTFMTSGYIEKYKVEIEQTLRNAGYNGGVLESYSEYFHNHGAVYSMFDSEKMTQQEARQFILTWIENSRLH